MDTKLTTIDQLETLSQADALAFLSNYENLKSVIEKVCDDALAVVPDVTTKKGRDEIGSRASAISRSKTYITGKIDDVTKNYKRIIADCNATKKQVEDQFNGTRDLILKPRNEWTAEQQRIEQARIDEIKGRIRNLSMLGDWIETETKEELGHKVEALAAVDVSTGFDEFTQEAAEAIKSSTQKLNDRIIEIATEEARAADRAEIEALRAQLAALQSKTVPDAPQDAVAEEEPMFTYDLNAEINGESYVAKGVHSAVDVTVITFSSRSYEQLEEFDYRDRIEIRKTDSNGEKIIFSVGDGEPEDSNLGRDFNDCHSVLNLMQSAYEAGKRGEVWKFEFGDLED
jgi:hypothetical protein